MSETFKIVGMFFRDREGSPASAVLGCLAGGCQLWLYREPSNQFDANAMQVLVRPSDFKDNPSSMDRLAEGLINYGKEVSEVMDQEYFFLGYIQRDKASAELLDKLDQYIPGFLTFDPAGKACVEVY